MMKLRLLPTWWSSSSRPENSRTPTQQCVYLIMRHPHEPDGWDCLGIVHKARGENRQAADCYRKMRDIMRRRPDDYDQSETEFAALIDKLDPPVGREKVSPQIIEPRGGTTSTPLTNYDEIAGVLPSICVSNLTKLRPLRRVFPSGVRCGENGSLDMNERCDVARKLCVQVASAADKLLVRCALIDEILES